MQPLPWALSPPAHSLPRQSHTAGGTVLVPDAALGRGQRPAPGHTVGSVSVRERVREAGAPAATLQPVCQPGESLSAHPYPGPGAQDLPLFRVGVMGLWTRVPSSMGRFPEGPQGRFRGWDGCRLGVRAQWALLLTWPGGDASAGRSVCN